MKTEDIIEGFNRYIESIRKSVNCNVKGHVVLHRTIEPCIFKAYKKYKAAIYYIGISPKKLQFLIGEVEVQDRVIENNEDKILQKVNIDLIQLLLKITNSEMFNNIIKGEE